jgi:hypothetical protein
MIKKTYLKKTNVFTKNPINKLTHVVQLKQTNSNYEKYLEISNLRIKDSDAISKLNDELKNRNTYYSRI